jgi:hypothetical protein
MKKLAQVKKARSSNLLGDNPASQIGELELRDFLLNMRAAAKGRDGGGDGEGTAGGSVESR